MQTISPATALPPIAAGVTIAGGSAPDGLRITGNDVVVRGLVVNSFSGDGIRIEGASGVRVECSFVGTDATGAHDYGNSGVCARVIGAALAVIGDRTRTIAI